jgi:hypothetical protein
MDAKDDSGGNSFVEALSVRFSGQELGRLEELAGAEGATVEEYVRACVLGPRAPGPVEVLAEIIRRRLGHPSGAETTGGSGRG